MAGKIKRIIDHIIRERGGSNPTLVNTTKTKLILKGVSPDKFSAQSEDDPALIAKLEAIAKEMGVKL